MAIEWEVIALTAIPIYNDKANFVIAVHWKIINTTDEHKFLYGVTDIRNVEDNQFTSVESLTHAEIIGWVKASLGESVVQEYESIVQFTPPTQENVIINMDNS